MVKYYYTFVSLLMILAPFIFAQVGEGTVFNVKAFGAAGDGVTNDRSAIQRAVDSCSKNGGTVLFPPGKYLTGSIELNNNVDLYLQMGALILGSTDIKQYKEYIPNIKSYNDLFLKYSLFYAEGKKNISIRGEGIIDGQGEAFKVITKVKPDRYMNRPYVIRFVQCNSVKIEDITLKNSAMWMQQYLACENLFIKGITVYNHANQNNDMMDIDGCKNVVIADCIGDTEDDAITLKSTSPFITENISISNCVVSSHCNAIKTGTESTGGFRNIAITNIVVKPSANRIAKVGYPDGISGISLTNVDGGVLENITISNITIDGPQVPMYIRLGNRGRKHTASAVTPNIGTVKGITISNVVATNVGSIGCSISGIPNYYAEDISLNNITINYKGGGTLEDAKKIIPESEDQYPESTGWGILPAYGFFVRHVKNISFSNIFLKFQEEDVRSAFIADNVNGLTLNGFQAQASPNTENLFQFNNTQNGSIYSSKSTSPVKCFLSVQGEKSEKINLIGNDLSNVSTMVNALNSKIVRAEANTR
ncbi:MAG: glycosyl hydrolase family 28-related protein [Bacteroidota bacterium]|nr:glycosyl hydrolase family 28-related protein [Bacteroidota bacterium]